MGNFSLANLRHEARFVIGISERGLLQRLAASAVPVGVAWIAGYHAWTSVIYAAILVSEAVALWILRAADLRGVTSGVAASMLALNVISTGIYAAPVFVLAAHGEVPTLLIAFLWMFGMSVHISNRFTALPIFNWSQMCMAMIVALGMIGAAWVGHAQEGDGRFWAILALSILLYGANVHETMTAQSQVQADLAAARAVGEARLAELERIARTDAMTGILNRAAFDAGLAALLDPSRQDPRPVAVFLIDLDGFKPVNDRHGHEAGDAVLKAIGQRLSAYVSLSEDGSVLVARTGGDEFAVAIDGLASASTAHWIGERIAADIEEPIPYQDRTLEVGGSVGIALAEPGQGATVPTLCARADLAMFRAKAARKDGLGSGVLVAEPPLEPASRVTDADGRPLRPIGDRTPRSAPTERPPPGLADGPVPPGAATARPAKPVELSSSVAGRTDPSSRLSAARR